MENKSKTSLYIDDCRTPIEDIPGYEPWVIVRNYDQFVEYILNNGIPDYISFDHDLSDEHMSDYFKNQGNGIFEINYHEFKEKTGLDCINWLCNYIQDQKEIGNDLKFKIIGVHSANPVGAENIIKTAQSFIKFMNWTDSFAFINVPKFTMETTIE